MKSKSQIAPNNEKDDVLILKDTDDFRYIEAKDYPPSGLEAITPENDLEVVEKARPDERTTDYRDPLIDAYVDRYEAEAEAHRNKNLYTWWVIQTGAKAQKQRVEANIRFCDMLLETLGFDDHHNEKKEQEE